MYMLTAIKFLVQLWNFQILLIRIYSDIDHCVCLIHYQILYYLEYEDVLIQHMKS